MFKVFFFSLLFLSMQVNAAGFIKMPTDTIPPIDKPIDYKAKSKRQLTTAIVMVSVGGATIVVSAFGYFIAKSEDMVAEMFVPYPEKTKKNVYAIAGLCGAALALASIPVFRAASKNRKLAKIFPVTSVSMESANKLQGGGFTKSYFPVFKMTFKW